MAVTYFWLGLALDQAGQTAAAVRAYEEGVRLSPREPLGLAFLAHGLARAGRADQARARLAELDVLRAQRYVSAYDLALMEWLEKYIFPAEARTVSPAFVRAGTRLAAL